MKNLCTLTAIAALAFFTSCQKSEDLPAASKEIVTTETSIDESAEDIENKSTPRIHRKYYAGSVTSLKSFLRRKTFKVHWIGNKMSFNYNASAGIYYYGNKKKSFRVTYRYANYKYRYFGTRRSIVMTISASGSHNDVIVGGSRSYRIRSASRYQVVGDASHVTNGHYINLR